MLVDAYDEELYPILEVTPAEPEDEFSSINELINVPQEAYDEYENALKAFRAAEAKMRAIVDEARSKGNIHPLATIARFSTTTTMLVSFTISSCVDYVNRE